MTYASGDTAEARMTVAGARMLAAALVYAAERTERVENRGGAR